jgi:RNA polymerase sigma-70 factor (ECF subfamily)
MARLRRGDKSALEQLVHRYQNDIFRFCMHYLREVERAKEVAQETFIRVYVARKRFDTSRKFRPWVLCIARNLCLNDLKRKKAVPMESLEALAHAAWGDGAAVLRSGAEGPDEILMAVERRQLLEQVVERLADEAREIVTLHFFEQLPAREIAEIIGSTEGAVRTKLHRVLKVLRNKYLQCRDSL